MRTVCYCHNYSEGAIRAEVRDTGHSTIYDNIRLAKELGLCNCKVKHPERRCCLPDVNAILQDELSKKGTSPL